MAEDKIFADGFSFKRSENAPDFVVGRLSMKVDEAIAFLKKHEKGGWTNLNVKKARSGNYYLDLDTYEPKGGAKPEPETSDAKPKAKPKQPEAQEEDLPF